jgi:hypothetical protein
MKVFQSKWDAKLGWSPELKESNDELLLVFGSRAHLSAETLFPELRAHYPHATILIGSTAGEILGESVEENSMVLTSVKFDHTRVKGALASVLAGTSRREIGEKLARVLKEDDLQLVFVISDGQNVNGSALVEGLNSVL